MSLSAWEASGLVSVNCSPQEARSVSMCVYERGERKKVQISPGTASGLLTELPSGGLSPTMLGSWALGGGEYAGGRGPCSWSNFFGTAKRRGGREEGREGRI